MRLKFKQWKGRIALFLVLCMMAALAGCGREVVETGASGERTPSMKTEISGEETHGMETEISGGSFKESETDDPETAQKEAIDEEGSYTTAEDVSLYLHTYEKLPDNFITKQEARQLGWEGGSLEPYAPGKCIGGDRFGNYEGLLPEEKGRTYKECDIDTLGADSRGAKRIVYSNDGLIYYTQDHYASFTLLYD